MRGILYLVTMMAVLLVFGIIMQVVCVAMGIDLSSGDFWSVLIVAALFGFGGSMVSLFASKTIVKKTMKVQLITDRSNSQNAWLLDTVAAIAAEKGVKMPEVGIYPANEMNAFATGWNKDAALVCVSTGILSGMDDEELSAVLGHEMSHVSNGDMVTSCLLQGIMNTFVYALSMIIANVIANAMRGNNSNSRNSSSFVYYPIQMLLQTVFGFVATLVVMWFSRWREYRADAGAAEVYGKHAMIKALRALENGHVSKKEASIAALCIAGAPSMGELFMTHPTIEHRIEALEKLPN